MGASMLTANACLYTYFEHLIITYGGIYDTQLRRRTQWFGAARIVPGYSHTIGGEGIKDISGLVVGVMDGWMDHGGVRCDV